jgi:hypothetical protein
MVGNPFTRLPFGLATGSTRSESSRQSLISTPSLGFIILNSLKSRLSQILRDLREYVILYCTVDTNHGFVHM